MNKKSAEDATCKKKKKISYLNAKDEQDNWKMKLRIKIIYH